MVATFLYRGVRTFGVASRLAHERNTPWGTEAELAARRDQRARALARFAAETIPHYRHAFREAGLDPARIGGVDDLQRLPLLEKATLRRHPTRFRSRSKRGAPAIAFATSGSTGVPLTIWHDVQSTVENIAHCEPEKAVVGELLGRRRGLRQLTILYRQSTPSRLWQSYRRHTLLPTPASASVLSIGEPIERIIARIDTERPDVLSGYGSYLDYLFHYIVANSIDMHRPRLVCYSADALSDSGKRLIRDVLGIPVIARYSAVESFRIGFTCPQETGFHIRDDLCHLRIVDPAGRTLPAGEPGEIIISNLVNHATVLLNYRLGDIGRLATRSCPCGRNLPLLETLEGRTEDILELADGTLVHPRMVWSLLKHQGGLLRYQLRQHERGRFELLLVTARQTDFDAIVRATKTPFATLLGRQQPTFRRVDAIAPARGGKHRPVISCDRRPDP